MYGEALEKQVEMMRWLMSDRGYYTCGPESVLLRGTHDSLLQRYFWKSTMHSLINGETYYWEPEIIDFVWETSQKMPDWTVRREAMFSPSGFCWLKKPLELNMPNGERQLIVAYSWAEVQYIQTDTGEEDGEILDNKPGIILTAYRTHPHSKIYGCNWAPFTATVWRYGESVNKVIAEQSEEITGIHPEVDAEYAISEGTMIPFFRFIAAAFAFMEQRIFVPETERPDRASRRRLQALGQKDDFDINVVRLRKRYRRSSEQNDSAPVDWSCRWLVTGHWRQQHYRSQNVYKPIYIMPFVKGPDDKPLKVSNKIFAVSR